MNYAARLGHRALGTTAENPPVGCVIIKADRVLGVGWTQSGGRPHAETEALAMAGDEARGATAYVTLEPCAHHGRTPPCAEALVKAEIAYVVTAVQDPDPRVSGGGHAILRAGGIRVETGIGAETARRDLAGFLTRIEKKRPYVTLKLAVSADDKIAARAGERTPITGAEVQARVHLMRAQSDAILVGMETVLADDPELTSRLPGLEGRSPKPFVLSNTRELPAASKLAGRGAEVLRGGIAAALTNLAARGINQLMVEGGARTARSFIEAGIVDEIHLFRAPGKIGPAGVDALAGLGVNEVLNAFRLAQEEVLGADRLTVYEAPTDNPSP